MTILYSALMMCIFAVVTPSFASAEPPVLRWAADIESGAPFSFKDPSRPDKIIGYEAEVIEAVAAELGMKPEFVQNNWEGLVEGLKRGDYDVVINGLEITPDRQQVVRFTSPYYVTFENLAVRRSNNTISAMKDLEGRRVGTLTGSLAQRILAEQSFPMSVVTYSEEAYLYNDLALGRIEAVLMDAPISLYYAKPNPELKLVGPPIGRMEYGIASRLENPELALKLDGAVKKLIADGTLRRILERWGLWNELVAKQWGQTVEPQSGAVAYERYLQTAFTKTSLQQRLVRYWSFMPLLAKGAWMTLKISILSMLLAMAVGLLVALGRLYGPLPVRWLAVSYVEIFRGTPLLIQLFLIFYGLPNLGIRLDPFLSAILGLGLNYAACEAENYRAGINSIPKAQMDAAQALGLSWWQSLRHIVLPQAFRVVIPPVTNDFIALLKDSSLVSVITMIELTNTYGQLASTYFDYLGIGLLTAAVYFLIGLPFVRLSRYFERNLNVQIIKPQARLSPIPATLRLLRLNRRTN
jgi:polar amino acid transport system substrate-binding protein